MQILTVTALAAFVLAGCGSAAIPQQQLADSKAAVAAAEAVNAGSYPKGALHLKLARDQIQTAERLIEAEENEEAAMALERAEADANLAYAHAQAEQTKAAAMAAKERVQELRRKLQAGSAGTTSSMQGGGA